MFGNRDLNRERNRRAFIGFFLLYFFSLVLVGITVYQYTRIPRLENNFLREQVTQLQAEQRTLAEMNKKMDSIVVLVNSEREPTSITTGRISDLYLDMEKEGKLIKLNNKSPLELVNNLVKMREKLQSLTDIEKKLSDTEKARDRFESDLKNCRSELTNCQTIRPGL